jgi:hypothetical protein
VSSSERDIYVGKLDPTGAHVFSAPVQFYGLDGPALTAASATTTGELLLGGYVSSANEYGEIEYTVWFYKLDASGLPLWGKSYGDPHNNLDRPDRVNAIREDPAGNLIFVGEFYGKLNFGGTDVEHLESPGAFVVKLDAGGNHLWSLQGPAYGGVAHANDAAVDSSANLVLAGGFYDRVDFGGASLISEGPDDVFVAALDANGTHVWIKRFGDASQGSNTGPQAATATAIDPAGSMIVAGEFHHSVDFGTGPLVSTGDDIFIAKLVP